MTTKHFVVMSKPNCPACVKTKAVLDLVGSTYTELDVSENEALRTFLQLSGVRSMPQVFLNGTLIGGYEAVLDHLGIRR